MEPLDRGQESELAFLRSQRSAWVNMRPLRRLLWATLLIVVPAAVAGVIAAFADASWPLVSLVILGAMLLVVLPNALFPERALLRAVRGLPRESEMRRGDRRRQNWPG